MYQISGTELTWPRGALSVLSRAALAKARAPTPYCTPHSPSSLCTVPSNMAIKGVVEVPQLVWPPRSYRARTRMPCRSPHRHVRRDTHECLIWTLRKRASAYQPCGERKLLEARDTGTAETGNLGAHGQNVGQHATQVRRIVRSLAKSQRRSFAAGIAC